MAIIKQVENYFLGSNLINPRVYYKKIKEIIDAVNGVSGTVTQLTSITTGVAIEATKGVITTVALTNAAGAIAGPFTVTDSKVSSTSKVLLNTEYASGKTGAPFAIVESVSDGSFKIKIANGGSAVLNSVVKVHFSIV